MKIRLAHGLVYVEVVLTFHAAADDHHFEMVGDAIHQEANFSRA